VLPSDLGRSIDRIVTNLVDLNLARDARTVLEGLAPLEREMAARDGTRYLVRLVPYCTEDRDVQGVVVTLVNVTALKQTERERFLGQMTDLVRREQQDLLHTLHDSLGQTLTALGMLSSGLKHRLIGRDEAIAETAQQIAQQAQQALEQVRQLSKGLFPIEVDARNLMPALRQLASTTEAVHRIRVQVQGDPPEVKDTRTATQLYRIAQEAVTNAVKHAQPHTITIEVRPDSGATTLRVMDDGAGFGDARSGHDGIGLQIMRYRARAIGASFSVGPGVSGGTIVACTVRESRSRTNDRPIQSS
jgi:signal transduction histidine kinase